MKLSIYHKTIEDISVFDEIMSLYAQEADDVQILSENRRSYRGLEQLLLEIDTATTVVSVSDLSSLGLTTEDILNRLDWFISHNVRLFICKYSTTYEYGMIQPMNKAVLTTLLQSILNTHKNIIEIPRNKRNNSGRSKIAFPDGWDKLYEEWENKKITSKEFIKQSGLKKATFYNILTEYKAMLKEQSDYLKKYRCGKRSG